MAKSRASASGPDRSAEPVEAAAFPQAGFRVGEYVIEDILGQGSMSTVFLARDGTGHDVALKVFQAGPDVSSTMVERFRREVEACKQLRSHPHIITVFATGNEDDLHFIAMQRVEDSRTLRTLIEPGLLPIEASVGIATKIARALEFAHERNILHRDVKPTNIMIDRFGEPVLADFGVAALIDWPRFTVPGALTGTPLYMSPEQSRGESLTPSSDVYSLGVVLYEAVTGAMPYSAHRHTGVQETLRAVRNEAPRRPRAFREDISPDLEAVILKAIAKHPEERYPRAEEFARELERAMEGKPVTARRYGPLDAVRHVVLRYSRSMAAFGLLLGAMVVIMAYSLHGLRQVRYQELLGLARLRNSQHALVRMTRSAGPAVQAIRARQEVHLARTDMAARNWKQAAEGLQTAIDAARTAGDLRTVAAAELELARCFTMMAQRPKASDLYFDIVANPDAAASLAGQAYLEGALLTFLEGDGPRREVLFGNPVPYDAPVADAIACARGHMTPEALVSRVASWPVALQNDLYFAAAVMARGDGNIARAEALLDACAAASQTPADWPAPLADELRGDLPNDGR